MEDLLLTFFKKLLLKSAGASWPWTDSHPDYVVSKKTPEIHPNSFYYPSSHNHGIVETCGNYCKGNKSLGETPLATSMITDERVYKPKWFGVSPTIRADLCFVRLRGRSSFQYGWHIVSYRLREGFFGGRCDFRPSHPKVLPCFGHTCWMVWMLFNFQLLVVDCWKGDAIFVKFSQNRQSWAWFEKKTLQFCQFVRDLFVSEV